MQSVVVDFKVNGRVVSVDEVMAEQIRLAVVARLEADSSPNSAVIRALADELKRFAVTARPEEIRMGRWVLTERDGELALIRIPARGAVNYLYVAKLAERNGRWIVTDVAQEILRAL